MKVLIWAIVILVAAVAAALVVVKDPGYVLIAYDVWTVETSLSFLIVAVLLFYLVLHYGWGALRGVFRLPGRIRDWRQGRHRERAQRSLRRGLVALAEGRWQTAERALVRYVADSDVPVLNYLGAARAAQRQGAAQRRDRYLQQAYETAPAEELAVGLTQAELHLDNHQWEQALATLRHLHTLEPRNAYVLRLLLQVYRQLRDWRHLRELLPDLRARHVVDESEARRLERETHVELLHEAAGNEDLDTLQRARRALPRYLRDDTELLAEYAEALQTVGAGDEAERVVRSALRRQWSEPLVALYGRLDGADPARQLAAAEAWLKEHGRDPRLLLTAGRLCLRNRLWGKARIYLESSIASGAQPAAYRELGELLERLGDSDGALNCYRDGMALAVSAPPQPLPVSMEAAEHAQATDPESTGSENQKQ